MSPIDWAVRPLKRYGDFSGRSSRAEYWWFVLFLWLAVIVGIIFAAVLLGTARGGRQALFWVFITPFLVGLVGLIIPYLAVKVRRLHDQDLSGWLILLFFIPYVGGLIGLVFMCISGTKGPNRFGPDPYEEGYLESVFA